MAVTKWLAEDLKIEVNTGTEAVPAWTEVKGLRTVGHSPSTTRADAADFNSGGREEHVVVRRGDTFTFEGHSLEDVATGDQDPGQAKCDALAALTGLASIGMFRITTAGGRIFGFKGSAQTTGPAGGLNDLSTWACEVVVTGAVTVS